MNNKKKSAKRKTGKKPSPRKPVQQTKGVKKVSQQGAKKGQPAKKKIEGETPTLHSEKKSIPLVPIIFIVILAIVGVIIWCPWCTSTITFILDSDLKRGEPPVAKIIINGEHIASTDEEGKVRFRYKAKIGERLKVAFKKETLTKDKYVSLSDFEIFVREKEEFVEREIKFRFKKYVPPVVWYDVSLNFQSKVKIPSTIYLNGDSIGILNESGIFSYNKRFNEIDRVRLEFEVNSPEFDITTDPEVLVYNVNRNISGIINIYAFLKETPIVQLKLINEATDEPLKDIDVKFSDSEESIHTDGFGMATYHIQNRRIGETITYVLPQKYVLIRSGYEKIKLAPEMPDTLKYVLLCEASYAVRLVVVNLDGDPISGVDVTLEDQHETTNRNGEVSFEISRIDQLYNVKIEKDRYRGFSREIAPQDFVTTDTFRMDAIYGKLLVVDSLTSEPVPYVDIFEGSQTAGQTGSNGKARINILLNKPLKLSLRPPPKSVYLSKQTEVVFKKVNSMEKVIISRKPYIFSFSVKNDKGRSIKGSIIEHRGRTYKTDKKGQAKIKLFVVVPKQREEFEITYGRYRDKHFVSTEKERYEYERKIIIGLKARIVIKTSPEGGDIRVINELGKEEARGQSPLTVELDYGTYRFVASDESGTQVEITEEVIANRDEGNPIVIDLTNPVVQIKSFYNQGDYIRVTRTYETRKQQIHYILDNQEPYSAQRCETLERIATSFGKVNKWGEAAEIMKLQDDEGCNRTNPYFYRNFASILYNLGRWKKSADQFQKATLFLNYVPKDNRPEFHADCLYNQGKAMLNFFANQRIGNEFREKEACDYLDDMSKVFDDFIYVVINNHLNPREVNIRSAKGKIHEWRTDNGCK